ncbi:hypothetical protein [Novosphingobium rosa]|nr:hypothetical protein [Novosphingobium rosa]
MVAAKAGIVAHIIAMATLESLDPKLKITLRNAHGHWPMALPAHAVF